MLKNKIVNFTEDNEKLIYRTLIVFCVLLAYIIGPNVMFGMVSIMTKRTNEHRNKMKPKDEHEIIKEKIEDIFGMKYNNVVKFLKQGYELNMSDMIKDSRKSYIYKNFNSLQEYQKQKYLDVMSNIITKYRSKILNNKNITLRDKILIMEACAYTLDGPYIKTKEIRANTNKKYESKPIPITDIMVKNEERNYALYKKSIETSI